MNKLIFIRKLTRIGESSWDVCGKYHPFSPYSQSRVNGEYIIVIIIIKSIKAQSSFYSTSKWKVYMKGMSLPLLE